MSKEVNVIGTPPPLQRFVQRYSMNQWLNQKMRPTQFGDWKHQPGKRSSSLTYGPDTMATFHESAEIGPNGVPETVQQDSVQGPVQVPELPTTE